MIYTTKYGSPIGELLLAEKNEALVGLWMEGQKYFMGSLREETKECGSSLVFDQIKQWLDRYFHKEKPSIRELPLSPAGSVFRREVWDILCEIPYGEVTTYGEIAKKIAGRHGLARMSAQAVGGAVGHNPISIIIPCHRVVGTNGSLTGYAGGLEKKIRLLILEDVQMDKLFAPKKGTAL
ncbi:methylated-DNA--[protein]-cysteine S-methyltransferase [Diplocloster modestus]|uniref:Methylated-DNA--protein-cysteine methyltransferase n=1 Tax=Diplocloster modestus TaxID=2850322 RepID=A0ABS6KCD7_9FIRM|nr:methylated-DNA--[protein]-cysteine S-methyltransferase [Diplocloster modestus]MBU9728170.1 methylated-DNA--[protein]-cysteine S-methyltransferase [Diplocloster modestus]